MSDKVTAIPEFYAWILGRGRTAGTAALYVFHVKKALEHTKGVTGRLLDNSLAPKTRRSVLAALRAYAEFKEDEALKKTLKVIKLPPPDRLTPKFPLTLPEWEALTSEIDSASYISEPMRAILGMMSYRGFRVGDVLRLTRSEAINGLSLGELSFVIKGAKRAEWRVKPFYKYLAILADIEGWERVEDLISPGSNKERRRAQATENVENALRQVAKEAGLDGVHPHRLRRTFAVQFLKAQVGDPEALMRLKSHMSWSDLATAMQYVDGIRREELDAVEDRMFKVDSKKTSV